MPPGGSPLSSSAPSMLFPESKSGDVTFSPLTFSLLRTLPWAPWPKTQSFLRMVAPSTHQWPVPTLKWPPAAPSRCPVLLMDAPLLCGGPYVFAHAFPSTCGTSLHLNLCLFSPGEALASPGWGSHPRGLPPVPPTTALSLSVRALSPPWGHKVFQDQSIYMSQTLVLELIDFFKQILIFAYAIFPSTKA